MECNDISFLSLMPPIIVLIAGYLTKRIIPSLIMGILFSALVASNFSLNIMFALIIKYSFKNIDIYTFFSTNSFWETWNLFICIFLLALGVLIKLLQHSGASQAYIGFIKGFISDKKSAEMSSLFLSFLLFIDDYLSSLTVGTVMLPVMKMYKVSRIKLSFLVDSMSAPLAILFPFSGWVAAIIGFLKDNGIEDKATNNTLVMINPFIVYFYTVPFILYSFILVFSIFIIVKMRISFGFIRKHEKYFKLNGYELFEKKYTNKTKYTKNNNKKIIKKYKQAAVIDFFMPILFLLFSIIFSMLFFGDFLLFGGGNSFTEAMQNSSAASSLFTGSIITLFACTLLSITRNTIPIKKISTVYIDGVKLMLPVTIILILAWILGDLLKNELYVGEYIAKIIICNIDILFLPSIIFLFSTVISFAIGSSWGAAAMMFPIVIPISISYSNVTLPNLNEVSVLFPVLGAVLSGCIVGDHVSPISDTTIMSSTSCKVPLMIHVKSQMQYSIPIILSTAFSFFIAMILLQNFGIFFSSIGSILFGFLTVFLMFVFLNKQ